MKKISIYALVIILAMGLAACGRRNDMPATDMTILPGMDSTIGTNIPDPDVDTKMPMYTQGTNATDDTTFFTDPMRGNDTRTTVGH